MSETITSRPFAPKMACERCVFGRGEHAEFCEVVLRGLTFMDALDRDPITLMFGAAR
jgi:hypothetical protein